jgi:hypothetical protein
MVRRSGADGYIVRGSDEVPTRTGLAVMKGSTDAEAAGEKFRMPEGTGGLAAPEARGARKLFGAPGTFAPALDSSGRASDLLDRAPAPFARVPAPFAPSRARLRRAAANEARARPNKRGDRENERRDRASELNVPAKEAMAPVPFAPCWLPLRRVAGAFPHAKAGAVEAAGALSWTAF